MLMTSFDDALTRAKFSFVYFLQFYLLKFFDIFHWGGFEPPKTPSGYATGVRGRRLHPPESLAIGQSQIDAGVRRAP